MHDTLQCPQCSGLAWKPVDTIGTSLCISTALWIEQASIGCVKVGNCSIISSFLHNDIVHPEVDVVLFCLGHCTRTHAHTHTIGQTLVSNGRYMYYKKELVFRFQLWVPYLPSSIRLSCFNGMVTCQKRQLPSTAYLQASPCLHH